MDQEKLKILITNINNCLNVGGVLSSIPVDDDTYISLKDWAKKILENKSRDFSLFFVLALVQYAMREYENGPFYKGFLKTIRDSQIDTSEIDLIKKIIKTTIEKKKLPDFGYFGNSENGNGNDMYVEFIKAHAFTYYGAIEKTFDFVKAFHKSIGQVIPDDEMLDDLSTAAGKHINDEEINVTANSTPGLCYLVKSTRRILAEKDEKVTALRNELFMQFLYYIDDWNYGDEYNKDKIKKEIRSWLDKPFEKWKEKQDNSVNATNNSSKASRNRTPYLSLNNGDEIQLIIPEKPIRSINSQTAPELRYVFRCGNRVRISELNPSKPISDYCYYLLEKTSFTICPSEVFDPIKIELEEKETNNEYKMISQHLIPAGFFRMFNQKGVETKSINAENILLIKKGYEITQNNCTLEELNCNDWKYVKIQSWDLNGSCEIKNNDDKIILTSKGSFALKPIFDNKIPGIFSENSNVIISRTHPTIAVICNSFDEIKLEINNSPKRPESFREKCSIVNDITDTSKIIVGIPIHALESEDLKNDGKYTVECFVNNVRQISVSYIILSKFYCVFDKARFYCDTCKLSFKGQKVEMISDETQTCTDVSCDDPNSILYSIKLDPNANKVKFSLFGENLYIPVNKATYSFSSNGDQQFFKPSAMNDHVRKIWFDEISTSGCHLYVTISGATEISAYIYDRRYNKYEYERTGERCNDTEKFMIDLTEFVEKYKNMDFHYKRVIIKYNDNAERSFPLFDVYKSPRINPFKSNKAFTFKYEDGCWHYYLESMSPDPEVPLRITVVEAATGEEIIKEKELQVGDNLLENLQANTSYKYKRFIKKGLYPFEKMIYIDQIQMPLIKLIPDQMTGFQFKIHQIINKDKNRWLNRNYTYSILVTEATEEYLKANLFENDAFLGEVHILEMQTNEENKITCKIEAFDSSEKANDLSYYNQRLSIDVNSGVPLDNDLFSLDWDSFKKCKNEEDSINEIQTV